MKKVKIAIFARAIGGGGAQRAMVRYANGLVARGYEVDLVVLKMRGDFEREVDPRVNVVPLKSSRLAFSILAIAHYLRTARPHAIMSTEAACNVCTILGRQVSGVPTRVIIREGLFPSIAQREDPYLSTRLSYSLSRFIYPMADAVVPIAGELADDLAKVARLPREKMHVIAVNPVVTPALIEAADSTPTHPWFADDSVPIILGVGRLDLQKDFATLIKAFAIVQRTKKARLLILGEGPERARLETLVAEHQLDNVALPGFDSRPYAAMANCGVFVLSSRYEGLPNALIEALACGAPVVSTACPSGPRDVLRDGEYGELVAVGDHEALAAAVLRTLDAPPSRELQRSRGAFYSVENSVDHYIPVLLGEVAA